MELSAGDTATNTTINGGAQYISSGGNATSTTINEGVQIVFDGGTASTTTINGGYQEISSGGLATNTIIDGGDQYISSGGNAIDTTIENGYQTVFSGGNATSTIINGGFGKFPVEAVLPVPLLMLDSRLSTITVLPVAPSLIMASSSFLVVAVLLTPLFKAGFRKLVRGKCKCYDYK